SFMGRQGEGAEGEAPGSEHLRIAKARDERLGSGGAMSSFGRRFSWVPGAALVSAAAFGATFAISRSTTADPPTERSSGIATRKEWSSETDPADGESTDPGDHAEIETWATLVNV